MGHHMTDIVLGAPHADDERRRDFIGIAAGSFAAIGAGAAVWPLVNQMNPSADVLAVASTDVDLVGIEPGQAIVAVWRGQPVFVRNLTAAEQASANAFPTAQLRDPQTLAERTKSGHANWLVTIGVCTHLGCIPLGGKEGEMKGDAGGYYCPCHGSTYDTAGRIRHGPAPRNLDLPPYSFTTPNQITIG